MREALNRTILLVRDEVEASVSEEMILEALTGTHIAIVADAENIGSHSAQSALVTASLLMTRSGHAVHVLAPDVPAVGLQMPLSAGSLITELVKVGSDLIPGVAISTSASDVPIDLAIIFGDSRCEIAAHRRIRINATDWSGSIERESTLVPWQGSEWPMGGLAAATLAASEAFKCAMHKLTHVAKSRDRMATVFAHTEETVFHLLPEHTPKSGSLGAFDCISGGAIVQAALYTLGRIPGVEGYARVIEPEDADISNLNRYSLLRRSTSHLPKAEHLANQFALTGLQLEALPFRYDERARHGLLLSSAVVVGVDHIATRWEVQRAKPDWLVVGATTHWDVMVSFHQDGLGCAQCAHPYDETDTNPIPTVAFVSYLAGLLTAVFLLRRLSQVPLNVNEQQIYATAFHTENAVSSTVPIRPLCATCSALTVQRSAVQQLA